MLVLTLLVACTVTEEKESTPVEEEVLDVRVTMPDAPEGTFDLVGPEVRIEPYSEMMYCTYLDSASAEALIASKVDTYQGKYGHHLTLLSTDVPKPAGTIEDCTNAESMRNLHVFIIADLDLPAGTGVKIPAGVTYVLQSHYVNTGDKPLLTRDVARFTLVDEADVQQWAAPLATSAMQMELPPMQDAMVEFDCTMDQDVTLALFGGHMHEWGTRFEAKMGPDVDNLESIYLVDPWDAEYRDNPPVQMYTDNPKQISKGTVLRTHCEFYNDTDAAMDFPQEMCATFGYMIGTDIPFDCRVGE